MSNCHDDRPYRTGPLALVAVLALSACATGPQRFPVEATRFHSDAVTQRGTVSVEPLENVNSIFQRMRDGQIEGRVVMTI